jgi:hypothetical protein
VPEGTDPGSRRIYLTEGSDLIGVSPQTGRVERTLSGSAVNASAGVYVVRHDVALGLDQGANGDAWGYDIAAQRVTLAAPGLPWPHYFVDLGGLGGSADPASDMVIIADCAQLAPSSPAQPGSSVTPTPSVTPSMSASAGGTGSPAATGSPAGSASTSASGGATPSPGTSPSPSPNPGCLHPELVALNLLRPQPFSAAARGVGLRADEPGQKGHPGGG